MGKNDSEHSNTDPKREIELGLSRALTRPDGTEIPVLSEMVSRSLTNIEASNKLSTLHRIGDHELHDPDYRLVCAWAEELNQGLNQGNEGTLNFEGTLNLLFFWGAEISEGRFVELRLIDPLNSIPLIEGLEVRMLHCENKNLTQLDLTPVPKLRKLNCSSNNLTELNLTPVPSLERLHCSGNNLTELDLTPVPNLKELDCLSNNLTELDLTPVPNLKKLDCRFNKLTELDLTPVPDLENLSCSINNLAELDLTPVPKLKKLDCRFNKLTELDLTPVPNLENLSCCENNLTELDLTPAPKLDASSVLL